MIRPALLAIMLMIASPALAEPLDDADAYEACLIGRYVIEELDGAEYPINAAAESCSEFAAKIPEDYPGPDVMAESYGPGLIEENVIHFVDAFLWPLLREKAEENRRPTALADECVYVSSHDLGTIQFLDGGDVRLSLIGEPEELCRVNAGDDGANLLVCADDSLSGRFNFANGTLGSGNGNELLALWDHVWYRQCG